MPWGNEVLAFGGASEKGNVGVIEVLAFGGASEKGNVGVIEVAGKK